MMREMLPCPIDSPGSFLIISPRSAFFMLKKNKRCVFICCLSFSTGELSYLRNIKIRANRVALHCCSADCPPPSPARNMEEWLTLQIAVIAIREAEALFKGC